MSQLILPRRFISQPQGAVEVDWLNPLTNGLIAGFTGTSLFDATGRNRIVLAGTGAISPTERGLALIGNNASATGSLAIDLSPYRGFSYSGWAYISDQSAVGADDMLLEYTNNANNTAGAFAFDAKPAAGYVDILVRPSLAVYGVTRFVTPSAGWHYITYVIDQDDSNSSTQRRLYVDGNRQTAYSHPLTNALTGGFPNSTLYLMSRGNASLFYAGKLAGFSIHGRAISDDEANELAQNHWQLFRANPRVLYFDVGSGTTTVDSDLSDSYVLRAAVSSDLADSYAIRAAIAADLADSYAVLSSVAADLADSYAITASVNADLADSYLIRASVAQDLADSYAVRAAVAADLADSYTIEVAGTVSSDLADSYAIRSAIAADLADSYAVLSSVAADLADSYAITASVNADLADSYLIRASVAQDLADSYAVRAAVAADLADSYTVSSDLPGMTYVDPTLFSLSVYTRSQSATVRSQPQSLTVRSGNVELWTRT